MLIKLEKIKTKTILTIIFFLIVVPLNVSCLKIENNKINKKFIDYFSYKKYISINKVGIEIEPNDNFNISNEIINFNNVYGLIDDSKDIDVFSIRNDSQDNIKKINIILNDAGIKQLYVEVYDTDKNLILKEKQNKNIYINIYPGEKIYIKIYRNDDNTDDSSNKFYEFSYNLIFISNYKNEFVEIEPNNKVEKANNIILNNIYKGYSNNKDLDYFTFDFEKAKFLNISFKILDGYGNIEISDENGNVLFKKENIKYGGNIFPILFEKGKYYIKIFGSLLNYELSLNDSYFTGEIEFNDSYEVANQIINNSKIIGALSFENDIDIFYFSNLIDNKEIVFEIEIDGDSFIDILILDWEYNVIFKEKIKEQKLFIKLNLNKGIYFIKLIKGNILSEIFYNIKVYYK
ncbi:MAG: hypothetical protein N3A58_08550 [Spirochaetes bacterium]|nr:hypothetical protein [Spirochaetota bacterium]